MQFLMLSFAALFLFFSFIHLSLARKIAHTPERYKLKIEKGEGLIRVLQKLEKAEIIDAPHWFRFKIQMLYLARNVAVKRGVYRVSTKMTYRELIKNIHTGKQINYSIRVINGDTFSTFYNKISNHPHLEKTLKHLTIKQILQKLESTYEHPEGLFYADTYSFYEGTTDLAILKLAYYKLQETLLSEWRTRKIDPRYNYKNPYEALILASIIEKETALDSERPIISGVFFNRFEKNMRLQTDPTVIYGMGASYKGNIRRKDLETYTPYNTYRMKGLPPTPIALVDLRAIRAAMRPAQSNYIFFVAKHDGSGQHFFSETLAEHNRAVEIYQLRRRKK